MAKSIKKSLSQRIIEIKAASAKKRKVLKGKKWPSESLPDKKIKLNGIRHFVQ